MLRLLVVVVILVLILAALVLPRFRRALWASLVIVVSVIAVIIWLDHREREWQQSRLSLDQIELLNMQVRPGLLARSYVVTGRVRNHSPQFTIQDFSLQLTLSDCTADECEIVGQEQSRIPLKVPPSQSRDFQVSVPSSFRPDIQGRQDWSFEILEVRAQ